MKSKDEQKIWRALEESRGQPAGEIGNIHGSETPVLEGVNCSCKDCEHYVIGDLCGASSIELNKIDTPDHKQVVVCGTYISSGSRRY